MGVGVGCPAFFVPFAFPETAQNLLTGACRAAQELRSPGEALKEFPPPRLSVPFRGRKPSSAGSTLDGVALQEEAPKRACNSW
jgi:hypothetical protein